MIFTQFRHRSLFKKNNNISCTSAIGISFCHLIWLRDKKYIGPQFVYLLCDRHDFEIFLPFFLKSVIAELKEERYVSGPCFLQYLAVSAKCFLRYCGILWRQGHAWMPRQLGLTRTSWCPVLLGSHLDGDTSKIMPLDN